MSKPLLVLLVFALGLAVIVRAAFRIWGDDKPPVAAAATPAPDGKGFFGAFGKAASSASSPAPVASVSVPSVPVFREWFRASLADSILRTDQGQYEVGRMSVRGLVMQISNRVVRCQTPSGGVCYVVADDERFSVPPPAPSPSPAPVPDSPSDAPGLDYMQRRVTDARERLAVLDWGQSIHEARRSSSVSAAPLPSPSTPALDRRLARSGVSNSRATAQNNSRANP